MISGKSNYTDMSGAIKLEGKTSGYKLQLERTMELLQKEVENKQDLQKVRLI